MRDFKNIFEKLSKSKFRSRFKLKSADVEYIKQRGIKTIEQHARDFITKRLAPAEPKNDGEQTPMKGHPVFIAQHATATCCRKCLQKWHGIKAGQKLTTEQIDYAAAVIMHWIMIQAG